MIIELIAKKSFVLFLHEETTKILIRRYFSSVKWDGIWKKEEYYDGGEY